MEAGWLAQGFTPPTQLQTVDATSVPKPSPLPAPGTSEQQLQGSMSGIRSDAALAEFVAASKPGTAVVEFGTAWCHKCHEMFPQFYALSKQFDQHKYAVAQVEAMPGAVRSISYTPTFHIFRNGRLVDEVVGKEPQRLHDHLWLHAD